MKKWIRIFTGMLVMAAAICLAGSVAAAGGQIQVRNAGVVICDEVRVKPGENYVSSDKRTAPGVLTYTDSSGKTTDYLPVTLLSDLVDLQVSWSEERDSIVVGSTNENASVTFDYFIVGEENPSDNPSSPVFGAKVGPFTEVDPKVVDRTQSPGLVCQDNTRVQCDHGYSYEDIFYPDIGKYIVVDVTNYGKTPVTFMAGRSPTLGTWERFVNVDIAPGETLTRAFSIDEDAELLKSTLCCGIRGVYVQDMVDVSFSMKQYK